MTGTTRAQIPRSSLTRLIGKRRLLVFMTGLVAIAAIACGGSDSDTSAVSSSSAPTTAPAKAVSPGSGGAQSVSVKEISDNLPFDFDIEVYQREELLGGSAVKFSDVVAQGRPVVLNAWAGLCPPCRAEMPELQAIFEEFGDNMLLFGLDLGPFTGLGNKQDALDLIEEIGVTYPAGNTSQAQVVPKYKVLGMPSTYFIKPDGKLLKTWTGAITTSKLRELVTKLIAAS